VSRTLLGSALAALVLTLAASVSAATAPTSFVKSGVTIYPDDTTLGSPNAPILVMEYAAPSCPVCARFNADTMVSFKKDYIDTGKVFYVFRVFPINGNIDAAVDGLGRCLPADHYFPFLDSMFRSQNTWDPEYGISDVHGALVTKARAIGMNRTQADTCMMAQDNLDRINESSAEAMKLYAIKGTPTLVIDNVAQTAGAMPYPVLKAKLDALLPKKK
jgi:protein-disulfide isomerase